MEARLVGAKLGCFVESKDSAVERFCRAHTTIPLSAAANTAEKLWLVVCVNENIMYDGEMSERNSSVIYLPTNAS